MAREPSGQLRSCEAPPARFDAAAEEAHQPVCDDGADALTGARLLASRPGDEAGPGDGPGDARGLELLLDLVPGLHVAPGPRGLYPCSREIDHPW